MTIHMEKHRKSSSDLYNDMSFTSAFRSLSLFTVGPKTLITANRGCRAGSAGFKLDWDMSPLFPYINAVIEGAQYYEKPNYIRFPLMNRLCAFHPREGAVTPVADFADAADFLKNIEGFLYDIKKKIHNITPDHRRYKPASPVDIFRLLPGTNCRDCGYATCLAFAAALSRGRTSLVECPHLTRPMEETATFAIYDDNGNCLRTVDVNIDTRHLRQKISSKDAVIQSLETRLAKAERKRTADLEAANAGLPTPLTQREFQVLQMMADGSTNKEISKALYISDHTVKSHVIHIFNKLGVNDRTQASVWAASHGLLP